MMATNSNVPAMEPGVFGPRRRGGRGSRQPRLVDAQELWDIDDVASYLGVTKQTSSAVPTICRNARSRRPTLTDRGSNQKLRLSASTSTNC